MFFLYHVILILHQCVTAAKISLSLLYPWYRSLHRFFKSFPIRNEKKKEKEKHRKSMIYFMIIDQDFVIDTYGIIERTFGTKIAPRIILLTFLFVYLI